MSKHWSRVLGEAVKSQKSLKLSWTNHSVIPWRFCGQEPQHPDGAGPALGEGMDKMTSRGISGAQWCCAPVVEHWVSLKSHLLESFHCSWIVHSCSSVVELICCSLAIRNCQLWLLWPESSFRALWQQLCITWEVKRCSGTRQIMDLQQNQIWEVGVAQTQV